MQMNKTPSRLIILPNLKAISQAAAERIADLAQACDPFTIALSGGGTPRGLYEMLAAPPYREQIPWQRMHVFWGDERCVPPDHPGSNYRMAREALLDHVPIPAHNVHRIHGELGTEAAAQAYNAKLRAFFGAPWPTFDLVLLGLGNDGHTASLFPGSDALKETARPAVGVTAHYENRPAQRVTLTLPAINAARQVLFLAAGKAGIVQAVLNEPDAGYPAQRVRPTTGELFWLVDPIEA